MSVNAKIRAKTEGKTGRKVERGLSETCQVDAPFEVSSVGEMLQKRIPKCGFVLDLS